MKPADDELIAYIKESLTEHEEVYIPGAWENFAKKEKKRRGMLWLGSLSSAAAVLLIGFMFFYTVNKTPQRTLDQNVSNNKADAKPAPQPLPVVNKKPDGLRSVNEKLNTAVDRNTAVVNQRKNNNISDKPLIVSVEGPGTANGLVVPQDQIDISKSKPFVIEKQDETSSSIESKLGITDPKLIAKTPVKEEKQRSFEEFLNDEVKTNGISAMTKSSEKKGSNWEMGLVVAPSIGNGKKVNMGYGVSMEYALSDKVFISSGISYNEMGASKTITGPSNTYDSPSVSTLVQESKSLESVDASIVGIDIPLEIKYYLTKNIYTNVGVSAFAILDQKRNNNYVEGRLVEDMSADKANLASSGFKTVLKRMMVSEPVPSDEIRNDKYLGFYNISFGYKQKISGSKALSVEPFMKLPIKEFTKENLRLIGTGLKLKFDF